MIVLTDIELEQLTGRKRRDAQLRALRFMGIDHKIRPDGSLAVLRTHVERELGATTATTKSTEPDWRTLG